MEMQPDEIERVLVALFIVFGGVAIVSKVMEVLS